MQISNVIVMPNRHANPESVPALRHEVDNLTDRIAELRTAIQDSRKPPNIFERWWSKQKLLSAIAITILSAFVVWIFSMASNSYVDGRIGPLIKPVADQVRAIDEKTSRMDGILSVLQAQITNMKLSSVPSEELRKHRSELKAIANDLGTTPRDSPNFWPTSFQTINLLSRATSTAESKQPEIHLDDSEAIYVNLKPGGVFRLSHRIEDYTFTNSIIYLDPNVILQNVKFVNCVLIFPTDPNPPTPLQSIGNQLLAASDLSNLTLSSS